MIAALYRLTQLRPLYALVIDLPLALIALCVADVMRHRIDFGIDISPVTVYLTSEVYGVVILLWAFLYPALLQRTRTDNWALEIGGVFFAVSLVTLTFAAMLYLLKYPDFSRVLFVYFYLLSLFLITVARLALRLLWRGIRARGYGLVRTVIVGSTDLGERIARYLPSQWNASQMLGFVDDTPRPDWPYLGRLEDLTEVVSRHEVHEIILALPPSRRAESERVIIALQPLPVRVKIVPDFLELATIRASIDVLGDVPLIGLREPVLSEFDAATKRLFDFVLTTALLGLTWPLLAMIALWIKLDSPGPVFFVQERVGENGRRFRMYKFRSMVADAERRLIEIVDLTNLSEPVFKVKNDPRVTRAGRFLRRTSLDELPQLFNVWLGDMSLVGPRPEEAPMVARYNAWQLKRLAIKPGITGPMQVNGRGDLSLEQRLRLELLYIEQYSLWRDLKIILKTVPAVLGGRGAH